MKYVIIASLALLLIGCSYGDKYDNLKIVDGNGRVLILVHRLGDTYFIRDLDSNPRTPNMEINEKLENRLDLSKKDR